MGRLLIISNRLPFSIEKDGEEIVVRQSSGGLVSAIKSYFESGNNDTYSERIWVGSMEGSEEQWSQAIESGQLPDDFTIEPIFPDNEVYDNYYKGFSNSTLWPLFHYFPVFVEYKKEHFNDYKKLNQDFAQKIAGLYQPGDIIWVHDYQLMMVPDFLRRVLPEATIGFFLHIPFPSYEILRLIPTEWKKQLMQGIMGADLIGFHTQDYVQHFIQ